MPCANDVHGHEYVHRLMLSGQLQIDPLITHRPSFREAPQVYRMILDRPNEFLGIVFDWSNA